MNQMYERCTLCPRTCGVDRSKGQPGVCGQTNRIRLARAALHAWEEPCISGTHGSGAVFFSGCALRCVFCQNREIAAEGVGKEIDTRRLAEIFLELQEQGAHNINLVTAGHFLPSVITAIEHARCQGLSLPIVYNTSGYEKVESIQRLEGIVDIYLPDFKYMDSTIAAKYAHAPDYAEVAKKAIEEMVRQQPKPVFDGEVSEYKDGLLMKRGVIVRHLLLPGALYDAKKIVSYLAKRYGNDIYYSLMSQYTPLPQVADFPELNCRVKKEAYEHLISYAQSLGIKHGFTQERKVAKESFIPHFDYTGV